MLSALYENEKSNEHGNDVPLSTAFSSLLPYLRENRGQLILSLILLLGVIVLSVIWPMLVLDAIDGPISAPQAGSGTLTDLLWICLGIFGIQIASVILQYVQAVHLEIIGQNIMLKLKKRLFDHILIQDVSFFDSNPVGRLLARVESDTESLRLLFTNTVVVVVGDALLMLAIYTVLFWQEWRLALVLALFIPVLALMIWIFHRITSHRFLIVREQMAEVTAKLTEFIQGMSIVQIFHRGDWARKKIWQANEQKFSQDAYVGIAICLFFNSLFFLEYLKIGLVLLLGVLWGLTPGTIVFFILMVWKEFDPIARTADQLGSFQKGIAGARRVFGLLSIEPEIKDPDDPITLEGINEAIRFENVWFSYNSDENWVLRDVSFEIKRGQHIALAGVTGGGKSTIISLLLRLYDPQRGKITIDGVNIRDFNRADLRKRFALVLQDIVLFPGDIASNIGLEAEELSRDMLIQAAKAVAVAPIIERLPQGYETPVSEKGSNFSRGERQLLSFARAMAVDPDMLILDEATSSVDPETERTIQASLRSLMTGRTSLVVAHRLSTILEADLILVIQNGEIVERGTHTELIGQKGYYARLFELQFQSSTETKINA